MTTDAMFEREVVERLARIETSLDAVRSSTEATHAAIYGNGRPGLATRVDRLEQAETSHRWTRRAVIGAGLVFLVDLARKLWG